MAEKEAAMETLTNRGTFQVEILKAEQLLLRTKSKRLVSTKGTKGNRSLIPDSSTESLLACNKFEDFCKKRKRKESNAALNWMGRCIT